MQEYLNTETYEYKLSHKKSDGEWVEIPEGAEALTTDGEGKRLIFWKGGFNFIVGLDEKWAETVTSFKEFLLDCPKCFALWVRPQQPEALPFIDDNPQSLCEQYAEIEQVRQNGLKLDNGKPRHSLLPKGSINSIIAVLEFGAKKYEANNWQKVDNAKERYYDAAMRHIDSWWNGEKHDKETGLHHLAHAATNLLFLKWFDDKEDNNTY